MPFLSWAIVITAFLGNILLGLTTYSKNPKSSTNKWFALFSLLFATYLVFNQFSINQTDDALTLMWIRAVIAVAPPIVLTFFMLVNIFPNTTMTIPPFLLFFVFAITVIISFLGLTPAIFTSVIPGTNQPVPGPFIGLFVGYNIVFLGISLFVLVRKYRKARAVEKTQLRFFLFGAGTMFSMILITNIFFVVFLHISTFVILVPIYTLIFNGAVSYAIIRHRFLDIRLVIARTVAYTLLVLILGITYALGVFIAGSFIIGQKEQAGSIIASTVLALLMAFTFQPVRRWLEFITDKLLYKGKYDTNEVLLMLSKITASTLRLEDVTHQLLTELIKTLRISEAAFILLAENELSDVKSEGFAQSLNLDEADIHELALSRQTLVIDELEEGKQKDILRKLDISVVLHLRTEGQQVGLLALGSKESGDIFSQQDLSLLEIFTPEAAVAVQNALAYEEIRRFNITLQEEVDSATSNLRTANVRLKELDKLKDEFVSLASHELRTPLTAIRSYIWMALSGKGGPVPEKQKYYLDRSFLSTNRLIKLVNDMLNISRIESGRLSMKFIECTLTQLIGEVIAEVQPKIEEQKLHLVISPMDNLPPVIADIDKIKEVIINFMGNSIKFTPPGGTITVSATSVDGFVKVNVIDTGVGISQDGLSKLFTKFSTVPQETALPLQVYQSTGLGLYISKSIVQMHGGNVWATSDGINKGSTFSFSLPTYTQVTLADMQKKYPAQGLGIIPTTVE